MKTEACAPLTRGDGSSSPELQTQRLSSADSVMTHIQDIQPFKRRSCFL
uniref:Uncharacterized protein n=1 Tax=Anguilla anguilla TaxID=7936 RepID=A0A0E9S7R8_ANGAN